MVDQQFEDLCAVDCQGCRFIVRRCDYRPPNISFGAFIDYAVGCRLAHGADRPGRLICEFTSLSDLLRQCAHHLKSRKVAAWYSEKSMLSSSS